MTKAVRVLSGGDTTKQATAPSAALIYTRVSKLDARGRALSPATQLQLCRELPALRGLQVEQYEDLDFSGKSTQRPQYQAMLERLRRGDVAVVAAYSLSRLSRSVSDFYRLYEDVLQPAGAAFVSATETIDTSTPQGRAFMGMTAVWAQMERELTSERVRDNVEQQARAGRLVGMLPYGYKRVNGRVVVEEDEAAVVRLIFERYASGTFSYGALARWLNAEGIRPPSFGLGRKNDRAEWVTDAVREIIARETYVGRFVHGRGRSATRRGRNGGPAIQGDYPAMIDEAIWQACLAVRRRNGFQHATVYGDRTSRYALTGLLRCQRCGGTVHGCSTGSTRDRRDYYSCRRRLGARSCDAPFVRSDQLEAEVMSWLAAVRLPPGFGEEFAAAFDGSSSAAPRRGRRADRRRELAQRLERVGERYELGHIGRDEYLAKRAEIEAALNALDEPRTDVGSLPAISRTISSIVEDWERMDTGQRRRVLGTLLDVLVVDGCLVAATPKTGWLDYLEEVTALPSPLAGRTPSLPTRWTNGDGPSARAS